MNGSSWGWCLVYTKLKEKFLLFVMEDCAAPVYFPIDNLKKGSLYLLLYHELKHWQLVLTVKTLQWKTGITQSKTADNFITALVKKKKARSCCTCASHYKWYTCHCAAQQYFLSLSHTYTHTHNTQWWKHYRSASRCLGGRQASETTTVKIKFHLRLIPFPTSAESHCYCDSQGNLSQLFHCKELMVKRDTA